LLELREAWIAMRQPTLAENTLLLLTRVTATADIIATWQPA
jgi:hypothetical protein